MSETLLKWSERIIRWGFYILFFLVPLIFTNSNSELFELNKMWLTWEVTLFIAAAWFTKMTVLKQFRVQRTILDIPLLLFLLSQIISTIFSLDPYTSFWGYYSRFNGGLLSTITYVFLYYALVSNFTKQNVMTLVRISLASGLIVALWGLPSHFGSDPTCLLFRGTFDVSCWTDAFKPTVRIFSTLGQPAWMGAYLNVLLPITIAYALVFLFPFLRKELGQNEKQKHLLPSFSLLDAVSKWQFLGFILLAGLFYVDLIFTNTRASTIAFAVADIFFWVVLFVKKYLTPKRIIQYALLFNGMFLVLSFFFGTTISQIDRFTLPGLTHRAAPSATLPKTPTSTATAPVSPGDLGGTDSGKIREIVWRGALDAWQDHPLFGTGVETFAYAYYLYRPAEHNMTSEWDYLYNKAHNEYLNYLTTTGIFGLGTYLAFIGLFLYVVAKYLRNPQERSKESLHILALTAAFISILITNFFGFSVVIMNLYLFLIPVFVFLLEPALLPKHVLAFPKDQDGRKFAALSAYEWTAITFYSLVALYLLMTLIRFWSADKAYALGTNLEHVQEYQQAYLNLGQAVNLRPTEPVFQDEFATNNGLIAALLLIQNNASTSAQAKQQADQLAKQAIDISDRLIQNHPNNITFWKDRVRLFYALAQAKPAYLRYALDAIQHARTMAPTDAKVSYNLGALYRETGQPEKARATLENTIKLKPDYADAYYALGMTYNDMAVNKSDQVINPEMRQKAIDEMQFILAHLDPNNSSAKQALKTWGVTQ